MMSSYIFPLSSGAQNSKVNFEYMRKYTNGKLHKGVDLDAIPQWESVNGQPNILATVGGVVYKKGYDANGWGYYIVIRGQDTYYHIFAHMKYATPLTTDQMVSGGTILGVLGSSGNSTGPHLHYEVRQNYSDKNTLINPCDLLGIANQYGSVQVTNQSLLSISSNSGVPIAPANVPYEELSAIPNSESNGDYLFGRRCRIIVSNDNGDGIDITGLRIVFQCVKTYLMDLQYSIILVYNINRETEAFMLRRATTVTIEAGYEGSNYGEIFTGDIIQSFGYMENGTDFVLKIVAADSDRFLNEGFVNYNIAKGTTQRQAVESLANQSSVAGKVNNISDQINQNTFPRGKVFFGLTKDYLNQIAKTNNATLYMNNGQVNIIKADDLPEGTILKLTPQSGLIGTPQQTELGIKAKALLIPQIKVNRSVQIDNYLIQEREIGVGSIQTVLDTQGIYRIAKVTYKGDTRGNDWYAEFEAMTQAGYVPALLQNGQENPF